MTEAILFMFLIFVSHYIILAELCHISLTYTAVNLILIFEEINKHAFEIFA